jgi:hypothetical protein
MPELYVAMATVLVSIFARNYALQGDLSNVHTQFHENRPNGSPFRGTNTHIDTVEWSPSTKAKSTFS